MRARQNLIVPAVAVKQGALQAALLLPVQFECGLPLGSAVTVYLTVGRLLKEGELSPNR